MVEPVLSPEDLEQLRRHGLPEDEARRQIELFRRPPAFVRLERACGVGDGIARLTSEEAAVARRACEEARAQGRLAKFVPASGAASRMFQALLTARNRYDDVDRAEITRRSLLGDQTAREVLSFMDGFERFAFRSDLAAVMAADGLDAAALAARGRFAEILAYLLTPRGLNYAALPKGLIKFHRYPDHERTAFEEHLFDGVRWLANSGGVCRLHFTVSGNHLDRFRALTRKAKATCERRSGARLDIEFSVQKPSTDTIAVDLYDRVFRDAEGRLLFRPGGHGALIENLNEIGADVIFIENIDNVVPDHLKNEPLEWKQVLCGHLLALQREVFRHLSALSHPEVPAARIEEATRFAQGCLSIPIPEPIVREGAEARCEFLRRKLDRPLRVCGVVRNVGEPGGGPFWVRGKNGDLTLQIVEGAEVDPNDEMQRLIFASATHFNPVQIACGVRNSRGAPFDLTRYMDRDAVFITRKSKDGRELKALERPGLWNGAMADWTTLFVEIPNSSFNPVKTVNDLLRPEHQPPV